MAAKLNEITTEYRSFKDNQVLTAEQLNEMVHHLSDQDHLSRVCLHGVGIVCGFEISQLTRPNTGGLAKQITITQGTGITTDGDLMQLSKSIAKSKNRNIKIPQVVFQHYRVFEDKYAQYAHFIDGNGDQIELFELVSTNDKGNSTNLEELTSVFLNDKVVVLYLENYSKTPDVCTTVDCDNQGVEEVARIRILLIRKIDVDGIVNFKDTLFKKHNIYESYAKLHPVVMPSITLRTGVNNNTQNKLALASAYKIAITAVKSLLHKTYSELFTGFSDILGLSNAIKTKVLTDILNLDSGSFTNAFQYRYNFAKDLCDTYNELHELLLKLRAECCPDISSFPKHLLLGESKQQGHKSVWRHEFYHSPKNPSYQNYLNQARSLIFKVEALLKDFNSGVLPEVRITPSFNYTVLSRKSIPCYYNLNDIFLSHWNFEKYMAQNQHYQLGYHRNFLAQVNWVQKPLEVSHDQYDFLRIEGHFGSNVDSNLQRILDMKIEYGLDFDCISFDLNSNYNEFIALVSRHPSIIHKAGVCKGGTFILLAENNTVFADFALDYKLIEQKQSTPGCCVIVECSYPWVSSLKYLNNLARATKGTKSRLKPFAQEYAIQIIEYKINNHNFLNSPITIRIPIQEIFVRRIHAITEALNKRFDKGLVFDFNESQKRFTIKRSKDDIFVLRLRDITQTTSTPVYSYSNTGFFRNGKIFRKDAMICREIRTYNPDFYAKLHENYAPVGKDDDFGSYKDKWAQWNLLIEALQKHNLFVSSKRFIESLGDFPQIEKKLIQDVVSDVRKQSTIAKIHVDGDWVNGAWVNTLMLDHYKRNRNNTHDTVVRFINLRELLHHKTGVTKLSIYINDSYSEAYDSIILKYKTKVDFYFGVPTGENAFQI